MANEMRLIDPTEYRAFLERYIKDLYEVDAPMIAGAVERCLQKLKSQPAVDAVEVVHGRWIKDGCVVVCSNCGEEHEWDEYRATYCEDCGAKMDGGHEDGSTQV